LEERTDGEMQTLLVVTRNSEV